MQITEKVNKPVSIKMKVKKERNNKTKKNIFLIVTAILFLIILIFAMINAVILLSYTELEVENVNPMSNEKSLNCANTFYTETRDREFIISNQGEYNLLEEYVNKDDRCLGYNLPEINFEEVQILGKYTSTIACSTETSRIVKKSDLLKKVIYEIKITKKGTECKLPLLSMNWILVKDLPEEYKIEFKVSKA